MGVEGGAEGAHEAHLGIAGEFGEESLFGDADAVFAGDGTAEADGFVEDLVEGQFDAVHFLGVAFVGEEGGVEVAIAHVSEGADAELVALGDVFDEADHGGEFGTGNGGVFEDGGGGHAGEGGEGAAAGRGEAIGFGVIAGDADFAAAIAFGDFDHPSGFFFDLGGVTVGFHEEEGFAIGGETDLGVVFDAADGGAVEELEGAGDDAGGDDVADGLGGGVHGGVGGDHGFLGGGFGDEAEEDFGEDAEGAFGADEEILEGIAGDVLHAFVAADEDFAVGKDGGETHDIIAGDPVLEAAKTAGVFGDIAADGADFHRTGIGRIEEAGGGGGIGDGEGGGAGFGTEGEVGGIDFEDAIHAGGAEDDAIGDWEGAAGEART